MLLSLALKLTRCILEDLYLGLFPWNRYIIYQVVALDACDTVF